MTDRANIGEALASALQAVHYGVPGWRKREKTRKNKAWPIHRPTKCTKILSVVYLVLGLSGTGMRGHCKRFRETVLRVPGT